MRSSLKVVGVSAILADVDHMLCSARSAGQENTGRVVAAPASCATVLRASARFKHLRPMSMH